MWFWKKRQQEEDRQQGTPCQDLSPSIEIIAHKAAQKEVAEEAKLATAQLNKLLAQNGFTVKINLLARGEHAYRPKNL